MKNTLLTLVAAGLMTGAAGAQVISQFTFENYTVPPTQPTAAGVPLAGIIADSGNGTATALHATATTYSTPQGNGTAKSLSSNGFSIGDYYQFSLSTVGAVSAGQGIQVSYSQTGSSTGPRDFSLQYSTDGTNYTTFASYSLTTAGFTSSTVVNPLAQFSFDLSSVTALNNTATASFRITDMSTSSIGTATTPSGTVAATGTGRVDTFTVSAVPEPSTYVMLIGGVGALALVYRRKAGMKA